MSLCIILALSICSFGLSRVRNQVACVAYAWERWETHACEHDGAFWYTMREKKLVDMEEELKVSGEAQSNN